MYYEEALQYVKVTKSVLIEAGLCSSDSDCSKKELVFWEAGGFVLGPIRTGGVHLNLYQQSSLQFVSKLEVELAKIHVRIGGPDVTLTAYRNKHSESRSVLTKVTLK